MPSLTVAVPSVLTFTFFLAFVTNSNVTSPVGTPPPNAEDAIFTASWAEVERTDIRLCFLKAGTREINFMIGAALVTVIAVVAVTDVW